MDVREVMRENVRRNAAREIEYDAVSGRGCQGARCRVTDPEGKQVWVPESMLTDGETEGVTTIDAWRRIRARHDFEYWAVTCATVKDKVTGKEIKFRLNRAQRRVLAVMERQRQEGRPIRLIVLKARQWGCTTLIQMYMAWMQCVRRRNWHGVVCAQLKDVASTIRGMYSRMLAAYPQEMWEGDGKPVFTSYEGTANTRCIAGRDCRITVATSKRPEGVRGADFAMAHLTEVAYWASTQKQNPEDLMRNICSGVLREPETMVVLESTANGTGNYFHSEWLRAKNGESDKEAIFIPWYEIEMYRTEVKNPAELITSMTPYEETLWERHGCTLEQIQWYREKLKEYSDEESIASEFPTDDTEAFVYSGNSVFASADVEKLRQLCTAPTMTGDVAGDDTWGPGAMRNVRFTESPHGKMKVWRRPAAAARSDRYIVAVDIGGRSAKSDYSVIAVLDRCGESGMPEIAAQWRGHVTHDVLAWKAAAIASWYGEALLVIESNSLEARRTEGDHSTYILSELNDVYPNLYHRTPDDRYGAREAARPGFHTNMCTKPLVINRLVQIVTQGAYVERDNEACNELSVYVTFPNGNTGAREGCHDDIVMTRAIALYVHGTMAPPRHTGGRAMQAGDEVRRPLRRRWQW